MTVPLNRRDGHSQLYNIQHVSDLCKNGSTVKQLHLGSLYKSTTFIIKGSYRTKVLRSA